MIPYESSKIDKHTRTHANRAGKKNETYNTFEIGNNNNNNNDSNSATRKMYSLTGGETTTTTAAAATN